MYLNDILVFRSFIELNNKSKKRNDKIDTNNEEMNRN